MSDSPEKKKIIIDEDWKTQVEAEKEALEEERHKQEEEKAEHPQQTAESGQTASSAENVEHMEMPPASISTLMAMFASEAMIALGQLPHPASGKIEKNLPQAKYFIDMLEVLQQKTAGNLEEEEQKALDDAVHQLQLAFVHYSKEA